MLSTMPSLSRSVSVVTPPSPSSTFSDEPSAVSSTRWGAQSSPTSSSALHSVTSMVRLWPALAALPVRPVLTTNSPLSALKQYVPGSSDITVTATLPQDARDPKQEEHHGGA